MDEAEKYQQRLQAIAEKRRLQEEQDRMKRQLEDEKLRLQQMKRKSLRDQWLMEGPPLSPDSAGPRSPLWGPQAQQIEAHINKLQSEIVEDTHKHKEDGSISAQSHTDHHGNSKSASAVTPPPSGSSASGEEKSTDPSPDTSLTNGTGQDKKSHNAPLQHGNDISKGVETLLFLGYMEAEPGQGLCEDEDDDDDDVSAVIRAERVIITEEGEEMIEGSQDTQTKEEEVEVEAREEEREKEREEKGEEEIEETEEKEDERIEEREEKGEEEREETEEKVEEQEEKGEEEREETEEKVEEQIEEREEKGEEEREETEEKVEEGVEERVEEREKGYEEREEHNAADAENDREMSTEASEVTEQEEGKLNSEITVSNEDTKVKIIAHTDKKTSADADTDTDTNPIKDSATQSALNTGLVPDVDPAAAVDQENAGAATHPQSISETPGGAVQTPSVSITLPASAQNPNGAQKSLGATSTSTNAAAQFQEIPLGGATVEEEPLLASKVEPVTNAANQAEGVKTTSCQCCSVM